MGFIDSYKYVEKLCGEIYRDERRLSAYIDEMQNTLDGAYYVRGWADDLQMLKHCRWLRNKIVHEPGCTEENMCEPEDELWLDDFYDRIMCQTDPLAQYAAAIRQRRSAGKTMRQKMSVDAASYPQSFAEPERPEMPPHKENGSIVVLVLGIVVIAIIFGGLYLKYLG